MPLLAVGAGEADGLDNGVGAVDAVDVDAMLVKGQEENRTDDDDDAIDLFCTRQKSDIVHRKLYKRICSDCGHMDAARQNSRAWVA